MTSNPPSPSSSSFSPSLEDASADVGTCLREAREQRHASLEEMSQSTKIPMATLVHMEAGQFEALPNRVVTRGFLRSYANALTLDPEPLLSRYTRDFPEDPQAFVSDMASVPERRRRFGMALAVVILLLLLGLLISVIIRGRGATRHPSQLSLMTSPATENLTVAESILHAV